MKLNEVRLPVGLKGLSKPKNKRKFKEPFAPYPQSEVETKKPVKEGAGVPYTVVVAKKIEEYITISAVTADEAREIAEREGYEVIRVEDTGNGAM